MVGDSWKDAMPTVEVAKPHPGALLAEPAMAPEVAMTVPSAPTSVKLASAVVNTVFSEKVRCARGFFFETQNLESISKLGGRDSSKSVLMRAYYIFRFTRWFPS